MLPARPGGSQPRIRRMDVERYRSRGDDDEKGVAIADWPRRPGAEPHGQAALHRDDGAMLIRVSHLTTYRYDTPVASVIQTLRLTPRNHDGQFIMSWRIDVSADCHIEQHE